MLGIFYSQRAGCEIINYCTIKQYSPGLHIKCMHLFICLLLLEAVVNFWRSYILIEMCFHSERTCLFWKTCNVLCFSGNTKPI